MITIIYDSSAGEAVRDGEVDAYVEAIERIAQAQESKEYIIANELILTRIRLGIKRGVIPHKQITFLYNRGDTLVDVGPVDEDGRLSYWPKGFADYNDTYLEELIEWTMKHKEITT